MTGGELQDGLLLPGMGAEIYYNPIRMQPLVLFTSTSSDIPAMLARAHSIHVELSEWRNTKSSVKLVTEKEGYSKKLKTIQKPHTVEL